jgi:site-specific DNA recombinase
VAPTVVDLYLRTSSDGARSPDRIRTFDTQEADARAFAAARGLEVGEVFKDTGSGGSRAGRPGLQAALDRVRRQQSAGIVVSYLSRLTREGGAGMLLFQEIIEAGGTVYAPNAPDDISTADGRLHLGFQLLLDAHYREKQGELTDKAKAAAIAEGITTNAPPPGYSKGKGNDRRLRPNKDAPAIREAYRRRLREDGPMAIAEYLNSQGVRTNRGNPMTIDSVKKVLASKTYLGEARCGEHVNPAAHEPIVPADLWLAVQEVGRKKRGQAWPRRGNFFLLRGCLICAGCGATMTGSQASSGYRIYRCTGKTVGGCPNRARVPADKVEGRAVEALLALRGDVAARLGAGGPSAAELDGLQAALSAAERRLEQALREETMDALGDKWAAFAKEHREAHDHAAATLRAARAIAPEAAELLTLAYAWQRGDKLSPEDRRRLLRAAFPRIVVTKRAPGERLVELEPGYGFMA